MSVLSSSIQQGYHTGGHAELQAGNVLGKLKPEIAHVAHSAVGAVSAIAVVDTIGGCWVVQWSMSCRSLTMHADALTKAEVVCLVLVGAGGVLEVVSRGAAGLASAVFLVLALGA